MWENLNPFLLDRQEIGGMMGPSDDEFGKYAALAKALQAGSGAGLDSTGGRALVLEDLEATLKVTTFGEKQFTNTLFRRLKSKGIEEATAIMHEYTALNDYGWTGGFTTEIQDTLSAIDADLSRGHEQVRFIRNKRAVSDISQIVRTQGGSSTEAIQVLAGNRYISETVERYLYDGDSSLVSSEWDGLYKRAVTANVVTNKAGVKLSKDDLNTAAGGIADSSGIPSDLYMSNAVQIALDGSLTGNQDRINYPIGALTQIAEGFPSVNAAAFYGLPAAGFRSSFGEIYFRPHMFVGLRKRPYTLPRTSTEAATHPNAPGTPTGLAAVVASQTGAFTGSGTGGALTSGLYSGAYAGAYRYRVAAENNLGIGLACAAVTATVTADQKVTLTWNQVAGATCYRIFRSPSGGGAGTEVLITRVVDSGGGTTSYVDINQNIAMCYDVYMLDLNSQGELATVGWAQLAPLGRYMLPRGDTHIQWIQYIYGTLIMYATAKMRVFHNVGIY